MSSLDLLVEAQALEAGWHKPEREHRFAPPRRWRCDYFWPSSMAAYEIGGRAEILPSKAVALEVEGGIWTGGRHTRGKGALADMEKYNTMTAMGIRLIRMTPSQVCKGELTAWLRKLAA